MGKTVRWRGRRQKAAAQIVFPRESLPTAHRPREAGCRLRRAIGRLRCPPVWPRAARARRFRGAQLCGCVRSRISERISEECSGFLRMPGPPLFLGLLLSFPSAACGDAWDYRTSTIGALAYRGNGTYGLYAAKITPLKDGHVPAQADGCQNGKTRAT